MSTPEAPQGVTLHVNGQPHPADLSYVGVREDGIHVWHAAAVIPLDARVSITADSLPPRTAIQVLVLP